VVVFSLLMIVALALPIIPPGRPNPQNPQNITGPGTVYPVTSWFHVEEPRRVTNYNSTPPTSGDHWPRWARCGFYTDSLPDELIVHNLEHGNVVVSYNLPNQADVDRLRSALNGVNGWGIWGVARPYDKVPEGTVALAAWGVLLTLQGIDEAQIRAFFNAYAGVGGPPQGSPERVTCTTAP
jgi:hypothetical protein